MGHCRALSKYRAKPIVIDGLTFASQKEGKRYGELKLLERAGKIWHLVTQPAFPFFIGTNKLFTYYADFYYSDGDRTIIEDVKGFKTPVYRLKKKIIEAAYGIEITET